MSTFPESAQIMDADDDTFPENVRIMDTGRFRERRRS